MLAALEHHIKNGKFVHFGANELLPTDFVRQQICNYAMVCTLYASA